MWQLDGFVNGQHRKGNAVSSPPMSRWLPFRRDLGLQLLALYLLCMGPVIAAALLFDTSASARLEGDEHAAEFGPRARCASA
jgi:hypothetical protein